jgi:ribonuclease J
MSEQNKKKQSAPRSAQKNNQKNTNTSSKQRVNNAGKKTTDRPAPKAPSSAKSYNKKSRSNYRRPQRPMTPALPIHYTVLGGLDEIGKNMAVFEYGDDAFIIDCGMSFPDEDLLGVDVVLPDFSYAVKIKDKIRGIFITHGHEDHIGALPYLLKEMNIPVFAGELTVALIDSKLKEHGLSGKVNLNVVKAGGVITVSKDISVEFIAVNHSIPDAMALAIKTPIGYVVHTGDFKIDTTPVMGPMIDLARFGQLGNEGVLALMADSTNAERPGYTPSERVVGESFANLFRKAQNKRIIVATFSSNLPRIQQIMSASAQDGRKVAVSGRSVQLARKEYALLELFLSHPRRVFTRETLLERVWGTDATLETRTVDMHIASLRSKLGRSDAVETVRGFGYKLGGMK